jgi:hypothetical protein
MKETKGAQPLTGGEDEVVVDLPHRRYDRGLAGADSRDVGDATPAVPRAMVGRFSHAVEQQVARDLIPASKPVLKQQQG